VAFQMADDLIDLTSSDEEAGKSTARDLAKGKLTLPLIHAIAGAHGDEARNLRFALDVLAGAQAGEAAKAQVTVQNAVAKHGGVAYAKARAQERITIACAALESAVPDSQPRRLLLEKAHAVLDRKR